MSRRAAPNETPVREKVLENGAIVRFYDHSRRYFGDYFLASLEVRCEVALLAEFFPDSTGYAEARSLLGETVVYRRTMERMGVPAAAVRGVLDELMATFEAHSLVYLASPEFPRKLVMSQLQQCKRKVGARSFQLE